MSTLRRIKIETVNPDSVFNISEIPGVDTQLM